MSFVELTSISRSEHLPDTFAPLAWRVSGSFPELESFSPQAPAVSSEVKAAVRSLLRWGGYKPAGRGRPASEAIAKALEEGRWPSVHPLVDEVNRLSLYSGIPISVVDLDCLKGPFRIRLGLPGEEYIFNPSGQLLSLKGLLLLSDRDGPTGTPVKDSQRSKISASTSDALVLAWGSIDTLQQVSTISSGLESWCSEHKLDFAGVAIGE